MSRHGRPPEDPTPVDTDVPARVDRLPWSRFHTRLIVALGACWVLDGFETIILSNVAVHLAEPENLGLSPAEVPWLATVYLVGEVVGALLFGHLADRLGRRRLFFLTLGLYFVGSAATAVVVGDGTVAFCLVLATRVVAGMGIGGEYAAINSMIDELVPAAYRGRVDILVNGTYWAGAGVAAVLQVPLLSGAIDPRLDWRLAVLIGPVLAIGVLVLRRRVPESPRWLDVHGRHEDARAGIDAIEVQVARTVGPLERVDRNRMITLQPIGHTGYVRLARELLRRYPGRVALAAILMITQSLLYNAIFFNYATVLINYYGVDANDTARYFVPFAAANFLGPLLLATLFDKIGRRAMISRTYLASAALLLAGGLLFHAGFFGVTSHTLAWCVAFLFTSAGASSAYLTVSEVFPLELRAKAVAAFFATAQIVGSIGPIAFGSMLDGPHPAANALFLAFLAGAVLMGLGGLAARYLAVDAENQPLEDVATPLSQLRRPAARTRDR